MKRGIDPDERAMMQHQAAIQDALNSAVPKAPATAKKKRTNSLVEAVKKAGSASDNAGKLVTREVEASFSVDRDELLFREGLRTAMQTWTVRTVAELERATHIADAYVKEVKSRFPG